MKFQSKTAATTTTTTAKPVNFKIFSIKSTDEGYFLPDIVPTAFKNNNKGKGHAVKRRKRPWNSTSREAIKSSIFATYCSTFWGSVGFFAELAILAPQ